MGNATTAGLSVYQVFVERLLSLSAEKGTIADACRATGINRQQFNKYLSGKYLPSSANLAKISTYLNVDSSQLFMPTVAQRTGSNGPDANTKLARLQLGLDADSRAANLRSGVYWMFEPSLFKEGTVLITGMAIYPEGDHLVMTGVRRLGASNQANAIDRPVRWNGVVMRSGLRTSILFTETGGINGWRILSFDSGDASKRAFYSGILTKFMPSGSTAAFPIILQLVDANISHWRTCYRALGYVPYDSKRVEWRLAPALKFLQESASKPLLAPHLSEDAIQKLRAF